MFTAINKTVMAAIIAMLLAYTMHSALAKMSAHIHATFTQTLEGR